MTAAPRPAATQGLVDRYDAVRALLDGAMAAGPADSRATAQASPLLEAEARLLDSRHFEAWLDLYAEDTCLWIPAHPDDHPGQDQALSFDDRRRMRERAWHMHDPQAWALTSPRPLTARHLGTVAAWPSPTGVLATAALTVTHVRRGPAQILHGREVLSLSETAHGLRISAKILIFPEISVGVAHLGWLM